MTIMQSQRKIYQSTSEFKARRKEYRSTPEYKAKRSTPEFRALAVAASALYRSKPENNARLKAMRQAKRSIPEFKAREKAQRETPEAKERLKARLSTPEYKARQSTPDARARDAARRYKTPIEIPNRLRPNRCECCGEISARTLHLDHCHDSGRFRGWCCSYCNTGAGLADNPKRLRLRALYLERPFQVSPIQWAHPKGRKSQEAAP